MTDKSLKVFAPKVTIGSRLADTTRVADFDGKPADHTDPEAWVSSLRDELGKMGLAPDDDAAPLTPEQIDALRTVLPEQLADYAMVRHACKQHQATVSEPGPCVCGAKGS